MIKKILKILLLLISVVLVFAIGFVLTLQVTEYNPEDSIELTIENNLSDVESSYVTLDTTIRVLTFNTGYASLSETEDFVMDGGVKGRMDSLEEVEANIDGITDIMTSSNADIYLLQEVDQISDRSYDTDQYSIYQDALQMPITIGYNYRVLFVPFPFELGQMMGNVNSGIVTMANYHVDSATRVQLPGSFSWPLRLANLKRCIVVSRFSIQGSDKEFIVINAHLSAYDDGTMRLQEMEAVKSILTEETNQGNYVLLGGDFNQTFPDAVEVTGSGDSIAYDYHYSLKDPLYWQAFPMEEDWFLDNGFQFGVDITTPTCRLLNRPLDLVNEDNNQYYVIDGFIVSSNITIELVQTLDEGFQYSDHNPVLIEIRLIP
ncbi:MAG: endonuclease [Firmicutes bacterium]|nr:endonuclease [Bacillota bacterium]